MAGVHDNITETVGILSPPTGLVKKSKIVTSGGNYLIVKCWRFCTSPMKKYMMFMCLVLLLLYALPFFKLFAAQVILMHLCRSELISLSVEEVTHPHDDKLVLVHSYHIGLNRACSVDLLSFR
jgi:hypothetical protein